MRYKVYIICSNKEKERDFAKLIQYHSSFEMIDNFSETWDAVSKCVDFVFSLYAPESEFWRHSIRFFTGRGIPIITYSGIIKEVPTLSINLETNSIIKQNFRRRSYNKGFCIMGCSPLCTDKEFITMAEIAVKHGFLMQQQTVYYQ